MLGEHRQAGRSGVAAVEQQIDHRGMDPAAASRREQVRGELPDLLVGERVIGGAAVGPLEQETCRDGGLEVVGERVGALARVRRTVSHGQIRGDVAVAHARADRAKVSKAEASAEDRRVAERSPGPGRESCGTTVDEGPDR